MLSQTEIEQIKKEAEERYPTTDRLPRQTGYHENEVADKLQEAYIAGATSRAEKAKVLANSLEALIKVCKRRIPSNSHWNDESDIERAEQALDNYNKQ